MDTGFTRENIKEITLDVCRAGLEKLPGKHKIIKNPIFMITMESYVLNSKQVPKLVIIPVRTFSESAESRYKITEKLGLLNNPVPNGIALSKGNGGLWHANTEQEQITFYNKCMAEYIQIMTRYEIPTKFIDFYRMTTSPLYLFESLKDVVESDVTYERFEECYKEATSLCAR
jgi:hypothetical protein